MGAMSIARIDRHGAVDDRRRLVHLAGFTQCKGVLAQIPPVICVMRLQGAGEGQHLRLAPRQAGKPDQPEDAGAGLRDHRIARIGRRRGRPPRANPSLPSCRWPAASMALMWPASRSRDPAGKFAWAVGDDLERAPATFPVAWVRPRQPGMPERKAGVFRHHRPRTRPSCARRAFEQLVDGRSHRGPCALGGGGRDRIVVSVLQQ